MTARLRLEGVAKRFGEQTALAGIDLDVTAGRTAVVGRSGSGKSTLLRIVAGFERPDAGHVTLDGAVLADGDAFVPAHRRGIGYVSQDGALFPHLSVADNVGFGLPPRAPGRAARVAELLDMVELDRGMLERRPHQLSGGQQQRVALARALAREPRLMLLDEPFSALDPGLRESLRGAVSRLLAEADIPTILVTHDREEALSYADRLAVLEAGRLVQVGPPREVYLRPRDRGTALLLGEALLLPAEVEGGVAACALGSFPVGRIPRGPAEIMLRHEQVRLRPLPRGGPDRGLAVAAVEFRGATCAVALAPAEGPPLRVTVPAPDAPEPGGRVAVEVVGAAHLLDAPGAESVA